MIESQKLPLIVDIDDTLLKCERVDGNYINPKPIQKEIDFLNKIKSKGRIVILWTGRHWNHYTTTRRQLAELNINYDELIMGKVPGIYVDVDALTTLEGV